MFGFPLLLIPLAVFNIIVFLMRDVGFDVQLFALPLPSGATWTVELGDAFVTLGLFLLLLEVQKSARPGGKYLTDHLLSFIIFAGAAAEFVMLPQFANATFFLLTSIALVDFLSGVALRGRRTKRLRDTVIADPIPQPVAVREPAPPAVREPAPTVIAPYDDPPPVQVEQPRAQPVLSRAEPVLSEILPPRVEPIIDLDPMLDDQKPPVRPPATHP